MKKFVVVLLSLFLFNFNVFALEKGSILIENSTGKIISEDNSHTKLPPASMTKMMTLLITMENIDNGHIKLTDKVIISENASNMGGSQVYLNPGEEISVDDLVKSVSIASANDSAVALAEYIGGSVEKFVSIMNNKAKELGLKDTHFNNVHGLDDDDHYSSPHDMAFIGRELIKHKKILDYSSIYEEYLKKKDGSSIWMVNTNKLLKHYNGIDGLKTGFTNNAGYCLTATASRNGLRFISVVMGEETSENRSNDTIKLLDYGFNNYKLKNIISKNTDLGTVKVKNGKKDSVKLKLVDDVSDLVEKSDNAKYDHKINVHEIEAPIYIGDVVGELVLYKDGKKVNSFNITVSESIKKANIFDIYKNNFKYFVSGNI